MSEIFTELSNFTTEAWVRQIARIFGTSITFLFGGLSDILKGLKSADYVTVGLVTGKIFQQLFDAAL
jgi:hypothetical protein